MEVKKKVYCCDCKHEVNKGFSCNHPLHCEYSGDQYRHKMYYGNSMKWNPKGQCGRYKRKWWKARFLWK